jgi:opacity protein-like surface antigen
VGVTSTTLAVTGDLLDPQRGSGFLAGAFVRFGSKVVRVQPEVMVTTRNFSSSTPFGTIDVSSRTIDIPVLVVARLRPEMRVHPLLSAGPYLSFLTKSTQTLGGVESDLDDELKDQDAGFVVGLGLEIDARRGAFVLEGRYTHGLKNLSLVSGSTFKSRTVMASIGYRF